MLRFRRRPTSRLDDRPWLLSPRFAALRRVILLGIVREGAQFEPLRGPSRIMLAGLTLAGSGLWVLALVVLIISAGAASAIGLALLITAVAFALALLTLLVGWARRARRQR